MNTNRTLMASVCIVLTTLTIGRVEADFVFGTPVNLGPAVNTSNQDAGAGITPDGLSLYFWSGVRWEDVGEGWVATRPTEQDSWESSISLGPWDAPSVYKSVKVWPGLTTLDGLELYFSDSESTRPGGYGYLDLWMMKRATTDDAWGAPVNLGPKVNSQYDEMWPCLSPDGLELYFSGYATARARPGGQGAADIWVTRRATRNDPWGQAVNLGPTVNSASFDGRPYLTTDGLALFFDSYRPGYGQGDLYMTKRATLLDPWSLPVNLGPVVNSSAYEECAYPSADGSTLFFDGERPGGYGGHDIWQASILPVVDFTGDGRVDGKDVLVMAECWDQDEPLCDIGPFAWGNGIVDAEDLVVLAEYIDRDIEDPTLIAHWAMDENEGATVQNGAGGDKGFAMGNPVWQPDGGKVGGALSFDGVDDFIITGHVPGLGPGPFAVFAWVQGGAPGQLLLFHRSGTKWLYIDPLSGDLTADFRGTGRSGPPLVSDVVVTDGQWHRIGLVWDGTSRILYVDDEEVAGDSAFEMTIPDNGFMIGGGAGPGSYWSGLIDDVRIYNRVVRP